MFDVRVQKNFFGPAIPSLVHRAVEFIMSPDPRAHERAGRGVRNFDSAAWDREKQNAVLSGTHTKLKQNPAMKHHL